MRKQPINPLTEPSVVKHDEFRKHLWNDRDTLLSTVPAVVSAESDSSTNSLEHGPIKLTLLFEHFLSDYVPQDVSGRRDAPVSWMETVCDMQGPNKSLDLAMTALSMVRLGRKHNDEKLKQEGMAVYGKALDEVQGMLSTETLLFQEHTLASCMTLSIFKVLETSGDNVCGWISHVEGLSKLFQHRGPENHVAESGHRLFLGSRPTAVSHR